MTEPYDAKLKEAMAEIKAILDKHDIGGSINLVSKTHSEFRFHFPSWSAAQFENGGEGIQIKCKREDYPSKKDQKEALELTCHVLLSIRDLCGKAFMAMDQIRGMIESHGIEIDHKPLTGFFPHREN